MIRPFPPFFITTPRPLAICLHKTAIRRIAHKGSVPAEVHPNYETQTLGAATPSPRAVGLIIARQIELPRRPPSL